MTRVMTTETEKMLTDPEAHRVVRCSWCKKYFDSNTREYAPKPEKDCGDGICDECMSKMMEGIE